MSKMNFQGSFSKNTYDYNVVNKGGRIAFTPKGDGMLGRMRLIAQLLLGSGGLSASELWEKLKQYNQKDVSYALRRMRQAGIVRMNGKGSAVYYTLTNNGKRKVDSIEPVLV